MPETNGNGSNGNGHADTLNDDTRDKSSSPEGSRKLNPDSVRMVLNAMMSRKDWLRSIGDPRRSIDDECGYPKSVTAPEYYRHYDRDPICARVVQVLPKESWQVSPEVYEDEDSEEVTPFEEAWDQLGSSLLGEDSKYKCGHP